jgi:MoaA/NifB/PqqE/SkfB family radical SAM enzyme
MIDSYKMISLNNIFVDEIRKYYTIPINNDLRFCQILSECSKCEFKKDNRGCTDSFNNKLFKIIYERSIQN